jgi:3',5'-cyclic AMP phosphodiesterase CpdA
MVPSLDTGLHVGGLRSVILGVAMFGLPFVTGVRTTPVSVTGAVFLDANGNGSRDAFERGLPNVVVSNQVVVVTTGSDGAFTLADSGLGVVYVSVPSGYRASGAWWRPAARLGDGFGLRPAEGSAFTFLHASDTHISDASLPRSRRLVALIDSLAPDFVLVTGDLVRDALRVSENEARSYYELFNREIGNHRRNVWTVPGNHEIFGIERHLSLVSAKHPLYGRGMYRHYRGPDYYSFNAGGVHFVGLNTIDVSDLWYYGHVDSTQLAWLERDLAAVPEGTPVITFNHIPFFQVSDQMDGMEEDGVAPTVLRVNGRPLFRHAVSDADRVLRVLRTRRHVLALGGHIHHVERLEFEAEGPGPRFATAAAVVGPVTAGGRVLPSGVTLYRVRDGRVDDGTFVRLDPPR